MLPKTLIISGHKYKVLLRHSRTISKVAGEQAVGHADLERHIIYVATDVAKTRQSEVLLHEVLHAVDETVQAKMGEKRITQMSEVLFSVLHNNKMRF